MNACPASIGSLPLPDAQGEALERAYATPTRSYHNWNHVQEVLGHYRDVAAGPGWNFAEEAALAVLYHDAIYVAGRSDNETRSAGMAREAIARWLPEQGLDAGRVVELIELTARHGQHSPDDFGTDAAGNDTRHFLDCDMAILGAEPDAFDAYDRGIAAEYRGVVPGWMFRMKRRAFLKALLLRKRIFLSEFFHARYDAPARSNLRRAISHKR